MESQGTSSQLFFSLKVFIHILYIEGLTKIILLEDALNNMKMHIVDQSATITNIYFILQNAVDDCLVDEVSQVQFMHEKYKKLTNEKLFNYLVNK